MSECNEGCNKEINMAERKRKALDSFMKYGVGLADYPELEGLEVEVIIHGVVKKCVVAGCCHDVGITLVLSNDRRQKRVCLNGRERGDIYTKKIGYDQVFRYLVLGIVLGTIDFSSFDKFCDMKIERCCTMTQCAFS